MSQAYDFRSPTDYGDADQVSLFLDQKMKLATECLAHFEKPGGPHGTYNLLQYMGTGALAADIELMRLALGAPKISVLGYSYGTRVAAAYAAAFPHALQRVAVSGVMGPIPDLLGYAKGAAMNAAQIFGFLQSECVATPGCAENPLSQDEAEKPEYVYKGGLNDAVNELFARSAHGGAWYASACGEGHSFSQ